MRARLGNHNSAIAYPYRTCTAQTLGCARTNLGRTAGRDLLQKQAPNGGPAAENPPHHPPGTPFLLSSSLLSLHVLEGP